MDPKELADAVGSAVTSGVDNGIKIAQTAEVRPWGTSIAIALFFNLVTILISGLLLRNAYERIGQYEADDRDLKKQLIQAQMFERTANQNKSATDSALNNTRPQVDAINTLVENKHNKK